MRKFGYVRVSTKEQHTDRQLAALEPYEIPTKNLYCDYQSGKDFSRPAYQRMLKRMKKGDLLIVKSIDRLGRNYSEILNQWSYITKTLQADILVIDMPLLDTRSKEGDLTGVFVADLVLQILAYVAQTERDFIHQRQAEGIAAAKAKGVKFGRKPVELPEEFEEVCQQWREGKISSRQAAATLGMSHATFYRKCVQKSCAAFTQFDSKGRLIDTPDNV
jgi:DNA invertase Pin-like site-specific DNA recombinase